MKWFIMLRTGHEGPYSLDALVKRKIALEMKVWAEGLSAPVTLAVAVENSRKIIEQLVPVITAVESEKEEDEIPPFLNPAPEEDFPPPIPGPEYERESEASFVPNGPISTLKIRHGLALVVLLIVGFSLKEWVKTQEKFSISRATGMSPELFQKIVDDFKFDGWNKRIFFKEYVPSDMSNIWLVTSSFQNCQVDALFTSFKGKLLAVGDERVTFRASTQLKNHIAEFSKFEFTTGNKIIPGLYEMDLKATNCAWDSMPAKWGNFFAGPDQAYITRMKVVLYHKGNVEFNTILDKLIKKKMQLEIKNQNQEELFWQDLQQKFQTLIAISLQIEQLLLELSETSPEEFNKNLKLTVDKFTKNHGRFLTEFVVGNEKYFQELENSELSNMSHKRKYEKLIRIDSKNIGLESMKIIEQLQSWKKPNQQDLKRMDTKVKKAFETLKSTLNHRIIQLTEDRAN
ncbi:MAG: hypothetical protein H0V66_12965 [Bdellovibrionales bacterium]|nr:hypothetical protein [Bdellovibrionales bacterium]